MNISRSFLKLLEKPEKPLVRNGWSTGLNPKPVTLNRLEIFRTHSGVPGLLLVGGYLTHVFQMHLSDSVA